jgi:hypothetical protein
MNMGEDTGRLRRILQTSPGVEPVAVFVEATGKRFRMNDSNCKVTLTAALVSSLTAVFGGENVVVE